MTTVYDQVLSTFQTGATTSRGDYQGLAKKIFVYFRTNYSQFFEMQGQRLVFIGTQELVAQWKSEEAHHMNLISSGSGDSAPMMDGMVIESPVVAAPVHEHVPYEQQVADMRSLIKLVIKGASNACFVAGRGGIGKTYTVQKTLEELNLYDGSGYFLNSGSSSPAGLYRLLHKYRDQVILFDDSDGTLSDQDSRNLMKAATDTKRVRKIVWNKVGREFISGDEYDDEHEEQGFVPTWFEFTGKIIFISNLNINKLDPDGALRTRGLMVGIDPTDKIGRAHV